jgi:hypothetical protein
VSWRATLEGLRRARYGFKSAFLPDFEPMIQPAEHNKAATHAAAPPPADVQPQLSMTREFILRHQIVERYLAGRLPPKGVQDFEHFCAQNPDLLDEFGLPTQVNAALRLLEAGGRPPPWEERPLKPWQRPQVLIAALVIAIGLGVVALFLQAHLHVAERRAASLAQQITIRPVDPATSTRSVTLIPSRAAPSRRDAVVFDGRAAQIADLKIDMSWSAFTVFRVTIDRIDQGRVAVIHNALRDSAGHVHIALNTSALGPGSYQFALEGLNWRGEATPQAWITVGVSR